MKSLHDILHHLIVTVVVLAAPMVLPLDTALAGDRLELIDVFQLEYASDPQISPNGERIIYIRNSMDIMKDRRRSDLWIIDTNGGNHRPLVADDHNASQPRWSADGERVAYVVSENGSSEIYCRWMDTGQSAKLTQLPSSPGHLSWSVDGKQIAFTMLVEEKQKPFVELPEKPKGAEWAKMPKVIQKTIYRSDGKGYVKDGFQHVFVIPAEGGTPRQLTDGPYHHQGPLSWSPNGRSIFFTANRNPDWEHEPRESEIFRVSVIDGQLTAMTDRKGPDQNPAVSPDGRKIAWTGFDDRRLSYQVTKLYVMDIDGKNQQVVTEDFDRDIQSPVWSSHINGLYFKYDDTGTTHLGFVNLDGKTTRLASHVGGETIGRPYASGSFSVATNGDVAYTFSQPDFPADVAFLKSESKQPQRITKLNEDLFSHKQLATTTEFWFQSAFDKRKIQSWIVLPPDFDAKQKYPLILEIHGGPFANYGDRFSTEIQLYAAAGYVVLYVNPRGSTGYGQEFANLIHHDYPGHDFDDLMSGVDAVIKKGFVDPDNMFVTGGSGGGILTSWIVGKTDRFRAAVAAKPVVNWYSFVLTTDHYPFFNNYWFPGNPWKHVEHYLRRSPISLIENVTTPTMLLTGEVDHRTPISESEQFYQALKLRKVDTALVRVPGASHAIVKRPSRLMVKVAHILKWFAMYRQD